MLDLVDNSTWNKTTDVILGYGYNSYSTMWSELEGYGFNVVTFYPNSYDGIVQVVKDIETIVGTNHSVSEQMAFVKEYIATILSDNGITNSSEKVTALYASYSSNTLKLGNNNSVTVDFINYAGGVNVAEDPSKAVTILRRRFLGHTATEPGVRAARRLLHRERRGLLGVDRGQLYQRLQDEQVLELLLPRCHDRPVDRGLPVSILTTSKGTSPWSTRTIPMTAGSTTTP